MVIHRKLTGKTFCEITTVITGMGTALAGKILVTGTVYTVKLRHRGHYKRESHSDLHSHKMNLNIVSIYDTQYCLLACSTE